MFGSAFRIRAAVDFTAPAHGSAGYKKGKPLENSAEVFILYDTARVKASKPSRSVKGFGVSFDLRRDFLPPKCRSWHV